MQMAYEHWGPLDREGRGGFTFSPGNIYFPKLM